MTPRYRVNAPHVVSETIDGESIVINLQNGCYYSLRETATEIWSLVGPLGCAGAIAARLARRYPDAGPVVADQVSAFIGRLCGEGLLVEVSGDDDGAVPPREVTRDDQDGIARPAFAPPAFDKYNDLQELLLADPIHEVGEGGWPTQLPPEARGARPPDESSR